MRRVVLISGVVGSGKTTLAARLADCARARGLAAASLDMDDFVEMVAGDWSRVRPEHRHLAAEVAGATTARLLDRGVALVAIAGSTLSPYEWDEVIDQLEERSRISHVLLRVSLEEGVRRTRDDPARASTPNPDVVARLHAAVDCANVPRADIDLDTSTLSAEQSADEVWSRIQLHLD